MICHGSNHIAGGGVAHRGPGGAACARAGWGRVELRGGVGVKGAQKPQTMGVQDWSEVYDTLCPSSPPLADKHKCRLMFLKSAPWPMNIRHLCSLERLLSR
jgi:hypothetical protein